MVRIENDDQYRLFGVQPLPAAPKDPVWEALSEVFGEPTTTGSRRLRNKVHWSLKRAGADGPTIFTRVQSWPLHFPGATLTETALEKHWDRLGRPPLRSSPSDDRLLQRGVDELELRRRMHGGL